MRSIVIVIVTVTVTVIIIVTIITTILLLLLIIIIVIVIVIVVVVVVILIMILIIISGLPSSASCPSSGSSCLLEDQSREMGGAPRHPAPRNHFQAATAQMPVGRPMETGYW